MNWLEIIAVIFGLLCVTLVVRQSIWCWPTGLVQVSLYIVIFYQVKLYSDVILHIFYVAMNIYGWVHWLHGGKDRGELPVTWLTDRGRAAWIGVTGAGTLLWGYAMASWTDAALPFGDAFTTVASLVAQWLMARKRIENWLFWIAVDIAAVVIYAYKGLYLTSGLYAVFLGLCIAGWIAWRRDLQPAAP
jgi:nicotinamide mononucleotide transporter